MKPEPEAGAAVTHSNAHVLAQLTVTRRLSLLSDGTWVERSIKPRDKAARVRRGETSAGTLKIVGGLWRLSLERMEGGRDCDRILGALVAQ